MESTDKFKEALMSEKSEENKNKNFKNSNSSRITNRWASVFVVLGLVFVLSLILSYIGSLSYISDLVAIYSVCVVWSLFILTNIVFAIYYFTKKDFDFFKPHIIVALLTLLAIACIYLALAYGDWGF